MTRHSQNAFTLIELLTATAVLALMVVALAQLSGITTRSVSEGLRRADNFSKARAALHLIAQDITGGVFRSDLAAFRDGNGAFAPAFYTRRQGLGGDRALSFVAYELAPQVAVLRRGNQAVPWNDPAGPGFGQPLAAARFSALAPDDYQDIAEGILRLEFFFVDEAGDYQSDFGANTRAVGIALAIADSEALGLLKQTGRLGDLRNLLTIQTPTVTESYLETWGANLNSPTFASFPDKVRSGVRIFERIIPLPN